MLIKGKYIYQYKKNCVNCGVEFISNKPFTKGCGNCVITKSYCKNRKKETQITKTTLSKLKAKEKKIFSKALREGKKYKKLKELAEQHSSHNLIAKKLNISRERVRQLFFKYNLKLSIKENKKCIICSNEFYTKQKNKIYCTKNCFYVARQKRLLEREKLNIIKKRERQKKYYKQNPHKLKEYKQKQKNKPDYFLKTKARSLVSIAIKKGFLKRPTQCSFCNKTKDRIEGHHSDYNRPLDVIWLCKPCHKAHDNLIKQRGI